MSPTLKLLRELIALPSVNPAFAPPGDPNTGELRMAHFLASTAAKAGLSIELREVLPHRPNLLAVLETPRKPKRRVLLAPHLDTVGVVDSRQFSPRLRDGRLFGRGACDTKGPASAMLRALIHLASQRRRPQETEIVFLGLIDEENGQAGSRAVVRERFQADLAIIGEPTQLKVVTAHKGTAWLQFDTQGLAAHGSRPDLGRNAVHEMARIIDLIETRYARSLARKRHSLLGSPTINVGTVSGGTQPNIVPAHCQARADRRTIPGESDAGVQAEIRALLRKHNLQANVTSAQENPCPPMETDPKLPLVRQFMDLAGQKKPSGVDYFCDAAVLAQGGIPGVIFGPGDIAQAHTSDEWISTDSLEQGADLLVRFLQSLP